MPNHISAQMVRDARVAEQAAALAKTLLSHAYHRGHRVTASPCLSARGGWTAMCECGASVFVADEDVRRLMKAGGVS
jgi:hypothetical protein